MRPPNPSAVTWDCPECGRRTRANRRTGLAYAHTRPESTELCPASAKPAISRDSHEDPLQLGGVKPEEKPKNYTSPPIDEARSTSVRAFRGGLPDTNRRRH
ncbi:hypothetical protein MMON44395_14250 [Mycolicibacterium monacense DSM 44395]|nr:hypothetical protein [Mycolicibacterium monacense DSM 44395]